MSSNVLVRKYSLASSMGFLLGLVFCMTSLLFAMVSRLSRTSNQEVIFTVCLLLGAGILLILAGINIAGLRQRLSRNYSFIAGLLLSATGLMIFAFSFPDSWLYPRVSYVIVFYSLGIFLLLINVFVNYFLQAFTYQEQPMANSHNPGINEAEQYSDYPVLATFAGILMTNITAGSYEPAVFTNTSGETEHYLVSDTTFDEKQPESQIMEITEENIITDTKTDDKIKDNCIHEEGITEPTALETPQFPEIVEVLEDDIPVTHEATDEDKSSKEVLPDKDEITVQDALLPFSEFLSMKNTDIKATDTMREAARKLLMFNFGAMVEHERGTKIGKDIEELHDMRVAAMRMRSIVEVLEEYIDMKKMYPHYRAIRKTRKVLGSVRDLDVFLEVIEHYLEEQPPERRAELDPLTDTLLIERAKHRGEMLVYLDDMKYNKFKSRFSDYLLNRKSWKMKSFRKNGEPIPCRVMDILPVLLYTQFATVRSYADLIEHETIDPYLEKYHLLRIDVKVLRYTLEFFKEVLGPESKSLIKDLKALQNNLGDMHDAVVSLQLLENFEKSGKWGEAGSKKVAVSAGVPVYPGVDAYIEYRKQELQKLVDSFPEAWSGVMDPEFSISFSKAIAGMYNS